MRWQPARPALLCLALAGTACDRHHSDIDPVQRQEAASLSQSIAALRQAPNEQKLTQLRAVEAAACTQPDTCALKGQCVQAYRKFLGSLQGIKALETQAPDLSATANAQTIAQLERELDAARALTLRCADAQAALGRHYKL
ncbi:MAG TPA: hypothetical protein VL137_17580 [Polyangiaceae bacterium]|nr:hypothetical protein [Polyangiaceae bacterium]